MLQIKNLIITHIKDNRVLIKDLSFTLNKGDKIAIIGEEGNGKSTILKLIYDESKVEEYIEYSGEIIRNNMIIGYLAQELSEEEKQMSVYEFMCQMPLFYDVTPKELARIANTLKIDTELFYSEQLLKTLSGGEKIKLPLSNPVIRQMLRDFGGAIISVSHDRRYIEEVVDKVYEMAREGLDRLQS